MRQQVLEEQLTKNEELLSEIEGTLNELMNKIWKVRYGNRATVRREVNSSDKGE